MTGTQDQLAQRLVRVRRDLARSLTAWSVGSLLVAGAIAVGRDDARARGLARQMATWGAIDLGIALAAQRDAGRDVDDPVRSSRSLRRLLWLNAGLDVGYLAAGVWLVRSGTVRGRDSVGDGIGVLVQGGALLVLDTVSALRLRTTRV